MVTIKDKFQVTLPAKLRERVGVRVGDLMEATVHEDGILLRPKSVVDREAVADRLSGCCAKRPDWSRGTPASTSGPSSEPCGSSGRFSKPSLPKRTRVAHRVSGSYLTETIRVVAMLWRFLREGTPWPGLIATEDHASGSTLRPARGNSPVTERAAPEQAISRGGWSVRELSSGHLH